MDLGSLRGLLAGECKQRGRCCARHTQAQVDEPRATTNARAAECAMVASERRSRCTASYSGRVLIDVDGSGQQVLDSWRSGSWYQ